MSHRICHLLAIFAACFLVSTNVTAAPVPKDYFLFDQADEVVPATSLGNCLFYDAGIATTSNGVWIAWLEFQPQHGDRIWLGLRGAKGEWIEKRQITSVAGDYANPTPTIDHAGRLWLSYERAQGTNWYVVVKQIASNNQAQEKNSQTFAGINHRVAAAPDGRLIVVCQQVQNGQRFSILGQRLTSGEKQFSIEALRDISGNGNAWAPSVAVTPDNSVHTICDRYDGTSYNVLAQSDSRGAAKQFPIAATPAFEAHAQIAAGQNGKLWVSWEQDGENWGKHYTARILGDRKSTAMSDNLGPLHRYRQLHFAEFDPKTSTLETRELPQPSLELARKRVGAPEAMKNFGAFYEKAQLVVDGKNRPWIVYRHFYAPWIGVVPDTHKQDNARIYARCLLPDGWSKLYSFSEGQGDGMQRISVSPRADGINVAWTSGRTDRRDPHSKSGGVFVAEISLADAKAIVPAPTKSVSIAGKTKLDSPAPRTRPAAEVAGKHYELFFGDLHRHTDISLCYSPADGTIDDAYRYAIDAAPLDFLGITDHTHDIAMGDPLSLIWWRSRKEVNRHALGTTFIPFYSYERSRADTDHNVISLRDDMLRPHTYPLSQFWGELDTNTFTIAHQPFNSITWNYKNDARRPLLEIYQGYRNDSKEAAAEEGLARGHKFGIIASSDHLSTSASYACVWTADFSREGIFRSMQARRTFGATAKINLKVTCGEHWMGESFSLAKMLPIDIAVEGTGDIQSAEVFVDGKSVKVFSGKSAKENFHFVPDNLEPGAHIILARIKQADGNRAWSSPMWVNLQP